MSKVRLKLEVTVDSEKAGELNKQLRLIAGSIGANDFKTVIETEEIVDLVSRTKKRYFAMVDELGIELGYQSSTDKKLWREQVKKQLGNESIGEMKTYQQISIKLEELHVFARTEFNFYFKPDV